MKRFDKVAIVKEMARERIGTMPRAKVVPNKKRHLRKPKFGFKDEQ